MFSSCLSSPSSNFLVSVLAFNFVFMGETSWESVSEAGTTSSSSLGSPRVRKLNSRGRQRLFSFPLGEEMAGGSCPEAAGVSALFVPVATLTVVPCPSGGCGIRGLFSDSHFISIHAKTAAKKLWNSKLLQGMQKLRLLALLIPCSLRKCPHKDPGEEGPIFMSFFKEKSSASVPETQCKWPHHQIRREGDFDGLWLHNPDT